MLITVRKERGSAGCGSNSLQVMRSRFVVGIPCVAASPIERDHALDVAAQIGRQAPGLAEEIVELTESAP